MARAAGLDMTTTGAPTAERYLGSVTKARILEAVAEARGAEVAERISDQKKTEMVETAEVLLSGTGWLPPLLRTTKAETPEAPVDSPAMAAE